MKLTKLNIAKHTIGVNGCYSIKIEVFEGQTLFEFNSKNGELSMITKHYQDRGHQTSATIGCYINTKEEFVAAIKWQLKNPKEVNFL